MRGNAKNNSRQRWEVGHLPLFVRTVLLQSARMKLLPILAALMITSTVALAEGPLRHVVSFKFKKEASADDIRRIETAFAALKTKIPQIQTLEWGTNVSGEKLDKGFTHMWVLGFADGEALKVYLDHPEHRAFVKLLKPSLEDAFVVDFQPR
jgi:hypothetical protein